MSIDVLGPCGQIFRVAIDELSSGVATRDRCAWVLSDPTKKCAPLYEVDAPQRRCPWVWGGLTTSCGRRPNRIARTSARVRVFSAMFSSPRHDVHVFAAGSGDIPRVALDVSKSLSGIMRARGWFRIRAAEFEGKFCEMTYSFGAVALYPAPWPDAPWLVVAFKADGGIDLVFPFANEGDARKALSVAIVEFSHSLESVTANDAAILPLIA